MGLCGLGIWLAAACAWVAPAGRPPLPASTPSVSSPEPSPTVAAPAPTRIASASPTPPRRLALGLVFAPAQTVIPTGSPLPPTPSASPTLIPSSTPASARRVPVLEYHYSTFKMEARVEMQTAWFEDQLRWLAENDFQTLTSYELATFVAGRWAPHGRAAALTFDVGASHFDDYAGVVLPALRRNGLHAIFFVLPSQTQDTCDGRLACWPDLLAWRDEGLIDLESHSLTHYDFATLPPERLVLDIASSKAAIEARTGRPVLGLSYPFDSLNPAAPDLLAAAGYAYAVAGATRADRSAAWADPAPFALPRYYPYSGQAFYPRLGGPAGPTFAEMMLAAVN